jgi:hypothetical protein
MLLLRGLAIATMPKVVKETVPSKVVSLGCVFAFSMLALRTAIVTARNNTPMEE